MFEVEDVFEHIEHGFERVFYLAEAVFQLGRAAIGVDVLVQLEHVTALVVGSEVKVFGDVRQTLVFSPGGEGEVSVGSVGFFLNLLVEFGLNGFGQHDFIFYSTGKSQISAVKVWSNFFAEKTFKPNLFNL